MYTVLFVDDTLETLESYKKMMAGQNSTWKSFFADNAGEALDIIESRTIDILITDLEMPIVNGISLLKLVQNSSPLTIRILLSGCTNENQIMESANLAHQIFPKPSCFQEIHHLLERSVYLQRLRLSPSARQALTKLGSIPSVPILVQEIIRVAEKENFSLREIGGLISQDIGMSMNILRLINSPFFGLEHSIASVEQAVSLLGLDILKPLIISVHFFDAVKNIDPKMNEALLKHSTKIARFCRTIFVTEGKTKKECDKAFITGFMHDLGRIILMAIHPNQYLSAIQYARKEKCGTDDAEQRQVQTTHAEISAFLLGLWGFEDSIIEAVHYHHSPSKAQCENPFLLAALHCADIFDSEINGETVFFGNDNLDVLFLEKNGLLDKEQTWLTACVHENDR